MDAIVLSGGGNRGAMEVGALRAIFEEGISPDLIVGTSVGAFNGAYIAGHPTLEGVSGLERIWYGLRRPDVFPGRLPGQLLQVLRYRDRLRDPSALRRLVEQYAPAERLEDLPVPLVVVAAALDEGREAWFRRGPLVPAVMASAAIPGVFPPVTIDGVRYVDGGVANNTPISVAVDLGADRVWVIDVGLPCRCRQPSNLLDILIQSLALQGVQRLAVDLRLYADRCQLTYIPLACNLEIRFTDFTKTPRMVKDAYALTKAALAGRIDRPPWLEPGSFHDEYLRVVGESIRSRTHLNRHLRDS